MLAAAPGLLRPLAANAARGSGAILLVGGVEAFRYAFMLPTATCVATACQLAGIGGAALFSPIFLLVFPLLGPEYPLASPAAAIASALLTEVFGFSSGLTGYSRRGLVDWSTAVQYIAVAVPLALAGALAAGSLASDVTLLRGVYAMLMLSLSAYLVFAPAATTISAEECDVAGTEVLPEERTLVAADGKEYSYYAPRKGDLAAGSVTAVGAFLTGLLGVGVGEVVLPQLVKRCCTPLPVAAGTSVAIVVVTAAVAAVVQFYALAQATGGDISSAIPWTLVQWTIPGVLVGGQLAPFLASRGTFTDEQIERFAASLFTVVGLGFAAKALQG